MVSKKSNKLRVSNGQKSKRNNEIISKPIPEEEEKIYQEIGKTRKVNVGLDISSSCIGVCVLDFHTQELIELFPIKLTSSKLEDLFDKGDYVQKIFNQINNKDYIVVNFYVEEIAKKFTTGKSSINTIVVLAKMNMNTCYMFYKTFGIKPTFINVRTARKILGVNIDKKNKSKSTKEKVFEIVKTINPKFPWITHTSSAGKYKGKEVYDKCNEDMCDSWIIAKSGPLIPKEKD